MTSGDILRLLLIAVLLTTSALFSAAEISILSLGRHRVKRLSGGVSGRLVEQLLSRPAITLGTLLVMITALNYSAEAIAAGTAITRFGLPVWTAIASMVVLVMVFAEAVPISYAAANVERVARASMAPLWIASAVLLVPARVVGYLSDRLARLLGGKPRPEQPVTEGEIRAIVDLQAEAGGLEEEEKAMIHQIFEFGEKTAREVMVPRTAIAAIMETGTASEAGRLATERRVSRLPVYRDDLDEIVGVLYVKDVLPLLASGRGGTQVGSVMRPAFRVPETKKLSSLLTDFRRYQRTLAIVVDEYGGTSGLVTLEDLLEEVVGDIYDEYDVVRPPVQRLSGGAIMLDGGLSIADAAVALGAALPEGEYDSVAGLVYSRLGAVPQVGQRVELPGVTLIVEELDGHRISRLRALRESEPPEGGADTAGGESSPRP